jgi:type IV secretory pathway VirB10-like protein
MKLIVIVMLFGIGCLTASGLHAEIYSWIDDKGVKHYSHTPPADQSLRIKTAAEIPNNPTDTRQPEIIPEINYEENVENVLEELDQENQTSAATGSGSRQELSRQQRIQNEKQELEDKLAYLESLPADAFANSRSRDVIIGQYRYRLQQLISNPDDYFDRYGF